MGCTYEIFKLNTDKHIKECEELFLSFFKDDMYWEDNEISVEMDERGGGSIEFDSEPFFKQCMMEDSVLGFFKLFCYKYPDVVADYTYYTEYSVDASSQDSAVTYKDGVMNSIRVYGYGDQFMGECEECGWDSCDDWDDENEEALFYIDDFDPDKTYVCPKCGAELDISDWIREEKSWTLEEIGKYLEELKKYMES